MASKKLGEKLIDQIRQVYKITKRSNQYLYQEQFESALLTILNKDTRNKFKLNNCIEIEGIKIISIKR